MYFPAEEGGGGVGPNGRGSGGQGVLGAGGLGGPHRKKPSAAAFGDAFRLFSQPSKAEAARQVEEFNAEQIMNSIDAAMIERVFTQSVQLDSQAIQHFVIKVSACAQL